MLLLEIGLKSDYGTVVSLPISPYCKKLREQTLFLLKNWRQNTLRNCRFAWKVKLEENTVRIFPVARNWRQNTLRDCGFA